MLTVGLTTMRERHLTAIQSSIFSSVSASVIFVFSEQRCTIPQNDFAQISYGVKHYIYSLFPFIFHADRQLTQAVHGKLKLPV